MMTGQCVKFRSSPLLHTCEIEGWCPPEFENSSQHYTNLNGVENSTILLKNFVQFSKFEVKRRNIKEDPDLLKDCTFHPKDNPLCPIFRIGDIVGLAGQTNFDEIAKKFVTISVIPLTTPLIYRRCPEDSDVAETLAQFLHGGVITITISWDCNLDRNYEECYPEYSFARLDKEDAMLAKGWNFRYADYHRADNDTESRDLFKVSGILFTVSVLAKAGKFSIVPLMLNIGSGLALLSLSPLICDLLLVYVMPGKQFYESKKYMTVEEPTPNQLSVKGDDSDEPLLA